MAKFRGRIAELGVRQIDVASALGVDPALLSAYLRGHRRPPEDFAQLLTDVLNEMERAEKAAAEARAKVLGGAA